ncbi:2-C-methyl-D-erythritol 4-phosphate cytidylyltransferase [Bulleidia sp. zg-1006]|uniref:2-C-methyl-D-erythritol 4-phosphate cytidylyltransferase n=1 Tax=Bulleidia sp. zg-1006 TaxID=2806552 RepID=UPI0019398626|nr:2-C-methyl-D-erythritol 4-phosphate cytidylyltransferase [Bulleidia sp. zg-1006]QRG86553.1 2-C-methyl-D-erythritol 4-phosphate cytidylyltransferase [Bulleidia sp. zg-1006]
MHYSVVIVAAGVGQRMKLGFNKAYAKLSTGKTIVETTVAVFLQDPDCKQIVLVTDMEDPYTKQLAAQYGRLVVARGGATRQESVCSGLRAVLCDYVLIHDGARPYVRLELIDRVKKALEIEKAALLAIPSRDTVKRVKDGYVVETYPRSELMLAQTPQGFETDLIIDCYKKAMKEGYLATDDVSLVEHYSDVPVKIVEGSPSNFKITTPDDLR